MSNVFSLVDEYLGELFTLEDQALIDTRQSIVHHGFPQHSVSATQGQLLYLLAKMCKSKRIIEIGTLGGYSTIWLGRALSPEGKLISIEIEPTYAQLARQNIKRTNLSAQLEIITGEAMKVLQNLDQNHGPVDLFFMDADKPNYISYFKWALENSRAGSLIIADNIIREGKILDLNSRDEKVIGVRNYLTMLSKEDRVNTSILPMVGKKEFDGIAISRVK